MILKYTLHHAAGINAVALSPDGKRLLSGAKLKVIHQYILLFIIIQDADVVIWNTMTGEKM